MKAIRKPGLYCDYLLFITLQLIQITRFFSTNQIQKQTQRRKGHVRFPVLEAVTSFYFGLSSVLGKFIFVLIYCCNYFGIVPSNFN